MASFKRALIITLITLILGVPVFVWLTSQPTYCTRRAARPKVSLVAASKSPVVQPQRGTRAISQPTIMSTNPLHWDWTTISADALSFPKDFMWAINSAAYQIESDCTNSDIISWQSKRGAIASCAHQKFYKDDIKLIKSLGVTAYRLSVEWSKIEPRPGYYDREALEYYISVCKELVRNGITPIVTLHYYSSPLWFAKLGGFEKEENTRYFIAFCKQVFNALHEHVNYWITFNAPTSYGALAYLKDTFPPGKENMQLMQEVIKNMCQAHVAVYQAIKKLPGGAKARVGITHNVYLLEASGTFDKIAASMAKQLFDDNIFGFFTTGIFKVHVPFKAKLNVVNHEAPHCLDFIGVNYYSHGQIKKMKVVRYPGEIPTKSELYTIYPEGLYRAIELVSDAVARPLNIPMYITENGIATNNPAHRELFFKQSLYALQYACAQGHPVKGYCIASLMDTNGQEGIFAVDPKTFKRTRKAGTDSLIKTLQRFTT